jgi:hypothetical protein
MIKFSLGLLIVSGSIVIFTIIGYFFNKYVIEDDNAQRPMFFVIGILLSTFIAVLIGLCYAIGDSIL